MNKRVLILDTEELYLNWWKKQLERHAITCETYDRPFDALEQFYKNPDKYSGVILDVWFAYEKIDGLETALRMLAHNGNLHVLFATGISNEGALVMLQQHGEVVSKPIDSEDYSHIVNKFVSELGAVGSPS